MSPKRRDRLGLQGGDGDEQVTEAVRVRVTVLPERASLSTEPENKETTR